MASKTQRAVASDVRAWAQANGMTVGTRGRFTPELQKAFNEANKGVMRYREGDSGKRIALKVRIVSASGKARTETKEFSPAEVRSAAAASGVEGLKVSAKGPFSKAMLAAAAAHLSDTPNQN